MIVQNVVVLPEVSQTINKAGVITLTVPIDSVERARKALEQIEVTAQWGQRILDKVEQYGEEHVLSSVEAAFRACVALINDG